MAKLGRNFETESLGRGQYRTTIGIKALNYQRNGVWRRIGNVLGNTGDPVFPVGVDELLKFRIRDKLAGQSPVLHFGKGQTHVRLTPLNTVSVKGIVDGQVMLFPEAWPNADFRATVANHFVELDAPLRTGHPQQFAFRIDEHAGLDVETLATPDFRILQPVLRSPNGVDDIPLQWVVTQQGGKTILTATLPEGDFAGWVLDPTLTLQPDAADGKDTFVDSALRVRNYGLFSTLGWKGGGVRKPLLEFNCTSIPSSAICNTATVSLYHATPTAAQAWTVSIYSIAVGNVNWPEGTKSNATGVAGDSCWNYKDQTPESPTAWAGSEGLGTAGTDYEIAILGSFSGNCSDAKGTQYSTALTASRVQGWFGSPNTNYGIVLLATADDIYGNYASDHTTAAERPKLVVEYALRTPLASNRILHTARTLRGASALASGRIAF